MLIVDHSHITTIPNCGKIYGFFYVALQRLFVCTNQPLFSKDKILCKFSMGLMAPLVPLCLK